jgi:integrase/recombinase XerD
MKVDQAVAAYVAYKQSLGMRFATEARTLKSFSKSVASIDIDRIKPEAVRAFLDGAGPMTRFWLRKFGALSGFYRFCLARGYVRGVPLPTAAPRCPQTFTPYIYTQDEIKRLVRAAADRARCNIDAPTSRTLLLLLYATGLRISEALNLNLADVDLDDSVLYIRDSKFYKTRLVPTGKDPEAGAAGVRAAALQAFPGGSRHAVLADGPRQARLARRRRGGLQADASPGHGASRRRPIPTSAA